MDSPRTKLDIDIQVAMSTVVNNSLVEVTRVDIPIGKVDLDKGVNMTEVQLARFATGYRPIPKAEKIPEGAGQFGPIDIIVTVIEANDLGDVIAKGATKVSDNKDQLSAKILQLLRIKEEEKKEGEKNK